MDNQTGCARAAGYLGRPQATFDAADLYHGIFLKTTALMDFLVSSHPFVEQIKGLPSYQQFYFYILFLQLNGCRFNAANDEVVVFILACARSELSIQPVTVWLHNHARI